MINRLWDNLHDYEIENIINKEFIEKKQNISNKELVEDMAKKLGLQASENSKSK